MKYVYMHAEWGKICSRKEKKQKWAEKTTKKLREEMKRRSKNFLIFCALHFEWMRLIHIGTCVDIRIAHTQTEIRTEIIKNYENKKIMTAFCEQLYHY